MFPCNRWLSKSEDDGALSRELVTVNREEYERRLARSLSRRSMSKKSITSGDNTDLEQKGALLSFVISLDF